MNFLPIFLSVKAKPCLVVGGGPVATGKIEHLINAGATVSIVSPEICSQLEEIIISQHVTWQQRKFDLSDLEACYLVIAATNDLLANQTIIEEARKRGILANAVSGPSRGEFVMPAIVDRSPLLAAVATSGGSPSLSRFVRTRLENLLPPSFGRLAKLAAKLRDEVKTRIPSIDQRRVFWDNIFNGPVAEMVLAGNDDQALAALHAALDNASQSSIELGAVFLVGAGPGDPDLLSLRAMRLIRQADVVVYDRLVSPAILGFVRSDAERIYAGKRRGAHTLAQSDINALLVEHATQGKRVLRLKGGDPFIFGRGGEEIASLAELRIPFEVVPGITAAAGCAAYAGIPLTHRDHAQSCLFVTGNLKDGTVDLKWDFLVAPNQTVVIYMGLDALEIICRELIRHGMPENTPAAVIQQGTTLSQKTIVADLATLPASIGSHSVEPPTLIIIGDVVKLRDKLNWFHPATQ